MKSRNLLVCYKIAYNGWVNSWDALFDTFLKQNSKKRNACSSDVTTILTETAWQALSSATKLIYLIYNTSEIGLFYQLKTNKSLHFKTESWVVRNLSKGWLNGLAATSALKGKLLMFAIAKYKNPRCFTGFKHLPHSYGHQKKSRTDSVLTEVCFCLIR